MSYYAHEHSTLANPRCGQVPLRLETFEDELPEESNSEGRPLESFSHLEADPDHAATRFAEARVLGALRELPLNSSGLETHPLRKTPCC